MGGAVGIRHGSAKVGKIVFRVIRRGSCSWLPECAEWEWGFVTSRGGQGAGVWWVPWWVLGGVACGGMLGGGAGQSVGGYSARVEPAVPIMGVMSRVVILVAAGSTQCACVVSEACTSLLASV